MPTSKLQQYIDIAKQLLECGPQTISQISAAIKTSTASLGQALEFLVSAQLVKEHPNGQYSIEGLGISVLAFFRIDTAKKAISMKT